MKFRIHRASQLFSDEGPCEAAFKEGGQWYIQFFTLEELTAFTDKEGHIVFERDEIWIYDDYME